MKNVTTKGPLKKSGANPNPPMLEEGKPRGKGMPPTRPNLPGSEKNHVILTEAKPAGRNSTSSTFRAPRGGESHDPAECGYTKPK